MTADPKAGAPPRRRVRNFPAMLAVVLVATGSFLVVYGCLRGYQAARATLVPLVRDGDPTRTLVDATRPLHARIRVRVAVRNVATALAWLAVAMYGMYLATVGMEGRA
jgi:hypothetical protein